VKAVCVLVLGGATITIAKGLISDRGPRKLAFYTLQKLYGKLADAEQ
jgi:hypothetical protein